MSGSLRLGSTRFKEETHWRDENAGKITRFLVHEIVARKRDTPLKIAIDGRCGAGKTTLADRGAFAPS